MTMSRGGKPKGRFQMLPIIKSGNGHTGGVDRLRGCGSRWRRLVRARRAKARAFGRLDDWGFEQS